MSAEAEAARDEAAVLLDALLTDRDVLAEGMLLFDRLPRMLTLALHRRRLAGPAVPGGLAPTALWRWEARRGDQRGTWSSRGDVFCVICAERLLANVVSPRARHRHAVVIGDSPSQCGQHLAACALQYLAGMREAVPPGTKVLPPEFRQEIE